MQHGCDRMPDKIRFGVYELDRDAMELRKHGVLIRLQEQPFRVLAILSGRPGEIVTREELQEQIWGKDTFVDFDQSVNFSIKQIRDVLGDSAERPLYIETVPKRGHRFIAPMTRTPEEPRPVVVVPGGTATGIRLEKALWTNIAELRIAETRRRRYTTIALAGILTLVVGVTLFVLFR